MAVEGFECGWILCHRIGNVVAHCNWFCRLASLCVALTLGWTSERRARAAGTRVRAVRRCGYKVEVEKCFLRPLEKGGIGKKYSIQQTLTNKKNHL